MQYFWVLGYTSNPLIEEYQERYFQKLLWIFKNIKAESDFFSFPLQQQKTFLLHPDISSLLMSQTQDAIEKFLWELNYFLENRFSELTSEKWKKIWNTEIRITLDDNNPQNGVVGHPDYDANGMLGWGEKTPEEWNKVFSKAFHLLQQVNSEFYNELNTIIKKVVPMKTSIDVHNSCSYKECIGTLYLWYTINTKFPELSILEALIHESSHNKLNLILQSERLTLNDFELKYYSPYRPDARHIHGVYLWVHAIVPTVFILLQAIEQGYITDEWWQEKILLYHIKNKLWYKVLQKYAKTTLIGRKILDEIGQTILQSDSMIQKNTILQQKDMKSISQRAKTHFSGLYTKYPYLQY